ncbi:MAG TPA: VOC family protein [Vitreimonas sp.]|uniref:VOC family protein n=1 Tax=Vitreimonas sp. TaxID=3069702 RepID=UPI002D3FB9E7|nr:VOC family protein [Vitreimonas sp.]HYD88855.1 VOC family protein [Vitreimonas sp.]
MNDAPMLLSGIAQIALASAEPLKLVAWYRDTLGLAVLFEASGMTFFQSGATRLMIGPQQPGQSVGGDAVIYFEPRDWSAAEAALEARGVVFLHPAQAVQRAPGRELMLRPFRDPEGHALAIMGWRAAD